MNIVEAFKSGKKCRPKAMKGEFNFEEQEYWRKSSFVTIRFIMHDWEIEERIELTKSQIMEAFYTAMGSDLYYINVVKRTLEILGFHD